MNMITVIDILSALFDFTLQLPSRKLLYFPLKSCSPLMVQFAFILKAGAKEKGRGPF